MVRALMWKEWREYRWKLAVLGILLPAAVVLIRLALGMRDPEAFYVAQFGLGFMALVLPLFVAVETVAGERASGGRGTWGTLAALPVHAGAACAVKLFWGLVTLYVPLVTAALLAERLFMGGTRVEPGMDIRWLSVAGLCGAYYLWTVVLGVRCATELGVVVRGLCFLAATILAAVVCDSFPTFPTAWWQYDARRYLLCASPFSFCLVSEVAKGDDLATFLVVQLIEMLWLVLIACWRFERLARGGRRERRPAVAGEARRGIILWRLRTWSPTRAMVWKAWRETRMLPVATLGIAVVIGVIGMSGEFIRIYSRGGDWRWQGMESETLRAVAISMVGLGFILAVAIGAVLTCADLQPKVEGFWRSRPIHAGQYYWNKYLMGLLVVLVSISVPWMALFYLDRYDVDAKAISFFVVALAGVVLVYTAVACIGCVLRRFVIVCLVGVAVALGLMLLEAVLMFYCGEKGVAVSVVAWCSTPALLVLAAGLAKFGERAWVGNWKLEMGG